MTYCALSQRVGAKDSKASAYTRRQERALYAGQCNALPLMMQASLVLECPL